MDRRVMILIGVLVVLIGAGLVYVMTLPKSPSPNNSQTEQQPSSPQQAPSSEPSDPIPQTPGEYKTYSIDALSQTSGRRLLFFYAAWCPQCRELDQTIREASLPPGMTIFKVNYDTQTDLRQKYSITLQTTMVEIDGSGNLVKKYVAYDQPRWPVVLKALGE